MTLSRAPLVVIPLLLIFILQESVINGIHFFLGGFTLYLAFVLSWILHEERTSAMLIAFFAGLIADLSPTLQAPFGLWTLVLTGFAYFLVTTVRGAMDSIDSPFIISAVTTFAVTATLILFLLCGAILGQELASISALTKELLGNALWTLILAPIYVPLVLRVRELSLTARER
jgi:rod shape-determining protein MreD